MMKTKQEAEDVLQNAFVDVFMKIDQYGFQSTPGAWIKRIVINNCLNQLKKKRVYFDDIDNVGDFKEEASILPDNNLTVERVQCNMKKLSEGYRTVLNLYLMEGYDHKEIAQILNITESTSKTQYFRAKKKLKMLMVDTNAKHA